MKLLVKIHVEEDEIPEELKDWAEVDWGAPGIALLLQDGDGGFHYVEWIEVLPEDEQ